MCAPCEVQVVVREGEGRMGSGEDGNLSAGAGGPSYVFERLIHADVSGRRLEEWPLRSWKGAGLT